MDEWGEEKRAMCEELQMEMSIKRLPRAYPSALACCSRCMENCMVDSGELYKAFAKEKEKCMK